MSELHVDGPDRAAVRGRLDFSTARALHAAGLAWLAGPQPGDGGERTIDLGGVTAANSAGLAVLIDWLGVAHRAGARLRYESVPEGLRAIARISEVDSLLDAGV